ncbi:hypothetical protein J2847_005960 [Azospirillum agricola]|uniref:hypothetical protein n=1 Tax=Azospirillum agricola TaxID=1720247 RepID=UPI001AE4FD1E|nr:hypothetical protein [Azospirillum agricola]MBP2232629.1 hypothetical protein [Azospirillum agricola]
MTRKAIPARTQSEVLVKSRRRCCICYGLNRDTSLKAGQIAHLDQKNSNSSLENLCYLCLEHHDEYDSTTRQRKNLTIDEVKYFRKELYEHVGKAFSVPVHFGNVTLPPEDPYAGQFIRIGTDVDSAEITVTPVPDGPDGCPRYHISGFALWGTHREYGPNMGDMSILGEMNNKGTIEHHEYNGSETYSILLKFDGDDILVEEENWLGRYGMNVNFIGSYRKA